MKNEKELREEWLDFWHKESQNCEQKYLTPDTHGIIIDFLTSHNTELLQKIEGMKKDDGRKPHELYSQPVKAPSHIDTYNQALDDVLKLLQGNK